ncbi:type I restriction-modification system restriction subunit [Planctomycetota bacterium]|nr:type I restriction-modification system restriction subunit [Planctomycetota bacterium]
MSNERETRQERIDVQLGRAGWSTGSRQRLTELHLVNPRRLREEATDNEASHEFIDYALSDRLGRIIAIVEAKRSSRLALEGERQAADYADALKARDGVDPFVFLANGDEIWFWHRKLYPPRKISGFLTEDDLTRLAHIDRFGQPLASESPDLKIVDRAYQIEAIKTICERIESAKRRFLMVLATGTGKTRIAVALIELLLRREHIKRVLVLADRRELVKQAMGAFKEHLPGAPRCWIEGGELDPHAQLHFATYPGMMTLYQRLSPGYYDLIIADESHRSIYSRYKNILDHFDALQLGLTATPTDFVDHQTFQLFDCQDNTPTFFYGYDEAVRDKHLVPYRPVHVARTGFQIAGLKPGDLPDEIKRKLRKQGVDVDEFSFEGSDLERRVSNSGTNDAMVREFMDFAIKDATGTLPAKAIIFAMSHRHALELYKSFNRLYPDQQRLGLAKVIDSQMERAEKTLDEFKLQDMPRVAISVDMLDTGVDVPAIRTLVFAKPVFSKVKFWQMLGRGTRLYTDPVSGTKKEDFLIIDHWNVFDYFQVNTDGRAGTVSEPLPSRLFRLRLERLQILLGRDEPDLRRRTIASLRQLCAALPLDNINVAPSAEALRPLIGSDEPWRTLAQSQVDHLSHDIAPLLRFADAGSYPQLQFENLTDQLALAHLRSQPDAIDDLREHIVEQVTLLPLTVPEVAAQAELIAATKRDDFWLHLTGERILDLQSALAPLMRFRNRRPPDTFVQLDLPDAVAQRRWISFGPTGEGSFAETYRARVEALVKDLAGDHPALLKIQRGETLSDDDLDALASVLNRADLFVTEERLREVYDQPKANLTDFLRHILTEATLPSREDTISQAFDGWVRQHPRLSATQLLFVRTLRKAVMQQAAVTSVDALRQPPFTSIGDPERLFVPADLADLLAFVQSIAA